MVFDTFVLGVVFLWLAISTYADNRKERYDEGLCFVVVLFMLLLLCFAFGIILPGGLWFCM